MVKVLTMSESLTGEMDVIIEKTDAAKDSTKGCSWDNASKDSHSSKSNPEELEKVLKDYLLVKKKNGLTSLQTPSSSNKTMINDANEHKLDADGIRQTSRQQPKQRFLRVGDDYQMIHNLDSEFESYSNEYRRHRQVLQQKVQDVDTSFMARSQMVQNKLTEAFEKMKEANDAKLEATEDKLREQLQTVMESSKKFWNEERQERLNSIAALEQTLIDKFEVVDVINKAQQKSEIAHTTASEEMQSLKQEMKNILVTLHYQFENLTDSFSKQEDEMRVFEQAQRDLLADMENSVQDLTSYVDTVQHEVSQIQLEGKAMWKQCEDEQNAARDILSKTMLHLVTETDTKLSTNIEEQKEQLHTLTKEMTQKFVDWETSLEKYQNESEEKLTSIEDKAKTERTKFSKEFIARIQETEDTIFQSIDIHMSNMENHQREMKDRLDEQNNQHKDICVVISKVAEDFIKSDRATIKKNQQVDEAFIRIDTTLSHQADVVKNLEERIVGTAKSTDDRFEHVCSRLEKLENTLAIEREGRASDREAAEARMQEHLRYMGNLKEKLVEANQNVESLDDRLKKLQEMHIALESSYQDLSKNFELKNHSDERFQEDLSQARESINGIEDNVLQLSKDLKCRSESHILASREFRDELRDVAKRLDQVDDRHEKMTDRITEQETEFSSIKISELVDASLQPFWKHHEIITAKMDSSTEEVRKLCDDVKIAKSTQETLEDRIRDVKGTSESLFQHLANSVQKSQAECREDVNSLKASVETIELALKESSSKIDGSREFVDNIVLEQKSNLHSVESKISSLKDEISCAVARIGSRQAENKLFREELAKEQFSLKDKVLRSIEDLLQWKREIETTIQHTSENLTREFTSQQEAADKQVAALVMKVAKDERKGVQISIEDKLERWSKKVEEHTIAVENRINELHDSIEQVRKQNELHDDVSVKELHKIVNTLSERMETTNVGSATPSRSNSEKFVLDAVDELRSDMITRNSMIVELDDRMKSWVAETAETMRTIREGLTVQQLRGEETDERRCDEMEVKTKAVMDLEAKVKEMTKKLTESRYECRGLRLKLLTKTASDQDAGCATV